MLQVARLAPKALAEAAPRVEDYLRSQLSPDGAGMDRAGQSDLYYTAFLLDGLVALSAELPVDEVRPYLERFGEGEDLDLVHRACLVRCWAALGQGWPSDTFGASITEHLAACRSGDGGFAMEPGRAAGTLYDAFLALGIYQDLGLTMPAPAVLGASFETLRSRDGGFANQADLPWGAAPSTAAAVAVLNQLEMPAPPEIGPWLLTQVHPKGGFKAMPEAPLPDLLSTATTLHALSILGVDFGVVSEPCLDFLDSLWSGKSFHGHWADDDLDAEYTFYALLALGHLT